MFTLLPLCNRFATGMLYFFSIRWVKGSGISGTRGYWSGCSGPIESGRARGGSITGAGMIGQKGCVYRGPKKHIKFFNINFLAPTQTDDFGPPEKKFMCLISRERTQKRDPHNFFRGVWGQKGGPKQAISATKKV